MSSTTSDRFNSSPTSAAIKAPCRVATTANITLSGEQTIDGVAVVEDDRVLVKDQSTTTQNGIYKCSTGTWSRSPDCDGIGDTKTGTLIFITAGSTYANTLWRVSTSGDPDPGEAMAFTQVQTTGSTGATGPTGPTGPAGSLDFSALTAETSPDIADLSVIYDNSAAANRKMTLPNILKVINGLTEDTAPDQASDFVLSYDTSASTVKKVKPTNLGGVLGKQTVWIPATAMISRTTNGASSGSVETTTNKNMIKTLDFDTTTQEFAQFEIAMPKSWNESTVTFQPIWSHPSTTTNFGVVWALEAVARSDDDAMDVAFGTAQTSTDTGGTTNDIYIGPESSAITIAGTPSTGDVVQFQIKRNVSDVSDTMAVDARLHGVKLYYTLDTGNDA